MHYLEQWNYCPKCGSKQFVVHDFKSKHCEACGFTYYFNAAAAVIAIIENEKGEMLVARRGEEPAKGMLDFIGGFVDPGEGFEEAVVREIEEETGWKSLTPNTSPKEEKKSLTPSSSPKEEKKSLTPSPSPRGEGSSYSQDGDGEERSNLKILFSLPNTYLYSGLTIHSCDCFFHVLIPSDAKLKANDDVAACWWEKPENIRVEDFGLHSARIGLQRFLELKKKGKV